MRFETLRETLLEGGIAPRHVRRYLRELDEHLDDLTAQQHAAGYDGEDAAIRARAQLGDDGELAQAMLAHRQLRSWTARAPLAVFGLLPPVATLAAMMIPIGCLVLISKHFGFSEPGGFHGPAWYRNLAGIVVAGTNLFIVPLAAALFVFIANRQRIRMIWPLMATAMLLLVYYHSDVSFMPPGHHGGRLSLGFAPIFLSTARHAIAADWPIALTQYVLSLLPLIWLVRRRRAAQ